MSQHIFQECIRWSVDSEDIINFWKNCWLEGEFSRINSLGFTLLHATRIAQSMRHTETTEGIVNGV